MLASMGQSPRRVSIAMATFNGREFIDEQLGSFLDQSRLPDELVVSDDGSIDGTLEALEAFARTAPFEVRVLANESRLGYALNFGRALAATEGDVVFLCDQDDVWLPEKIQRVLDEFDRRPTAGLVIHDCIIADRDLVHVGVTELGHLRRMGASSDAFVSGCCTAVRSDLLRVVLPVPPVGAGHDSWLHVCAQLLGMRFVLSEPLSYYRRHGRNQSLTPTSSVVPVNRWSAAVRRVVLTSRRRSLAGHARALASTTAWWRAVRARFAALREDPTRVRDCPLHAVEAAEATAADWLRRAEARERVLESPRLWRLGRISRAYAGGAYRGFRLPWAVLLDALASRSVRTPSGADLEQAR